MEDSSLAVSVHEATGWKLSATFPPSCSVAVNPKKKNHLVTRSVGTTGLNPVQLSSFSSCEQDAVVDLAAAPPRLSELPSLLLYTLQSASLKGGLQSRGVLARLQRSRLFFQPEWKRRDITSQYPNSRRDVIMLLWRWGRGGVKLHQQALCVRCCLFVCVEASCIGKL